MVHDVGWEGDWCMIWLSLNLIDLGKKDIGSLGF